MRTAPAFSRTDQALLLELDGLLANIDIPIHANAVADLLAQLVDVEIVGRWRFDRNDRGVVLADISSSGELPRSYFRELEQGVASGTLSFFFSMNIPEKGQRNRPIVFPGVRIIEQRARMEQLGVTSVNAAMHRLAALHDRYGIADNFQLRILICDGPLALDYVSACQPRDFTRRQRRVFQAATRMLRRRNLLDHRLRNADAYRATLEAMLAAFGREAFVVGESGKVVHANALGLSAIAKDTATCSKIMSAIAGDRRHYDVMPIRTRGAPAWFLVTGRKPTLVEIAEAMAGELGLQRRAREVLALAADGFSTKSIAASLGIADNTVEYHLNRVFGRLGVKSRVELQRLLHERA